MKNLIFIFTLILISGLYIGNAYALETDQKSYVSTKYNPAEIKITGEINDYQKGNRFFLELITPDNFSEEYDVRVTDTGNFSLIIRAEQNWINGYYTIIANYNGKEVAKTSFEIKAPEDFRTAIITKPSEEPKKETTIKTVSSTSTTIPEWVRNIALWYGQGTVSEDDFINAIQYLTDKGIIKLKGSSGNSTVEPNTQQTKTTSFPDPNKDPWDYIKRYNSEKSYKDWFDKNFPGKTIYEIVGLPEPKPTPPPVTVITPPKTSDTNIMTNLQFEIVFSNPDNYKGKWVKLVGEVEQVFKNKDGTDYVFYLSYSDSYDINHRLWISTDKTNLNIQENGCYMIEGKIQGGSEFTLFLTGVTSVIPEVNLEKYNEVSCLDAKYPAIKTIKVDQTQTKGNMKVTVKTIDITNDHTRVFVEVENLGTPDNFNFYESNSIIIQDKRQFKSDYLFDVEYDDVEYDIPVGVIEDGYIILAPIQPKSFQLILAGSEWDDNATVTEYGNYGGYLDHKFEFNFDLK